MYLTLYAPSLDDSLPLQPPDLFDGDRLSGFPHHDLFQEDVGSVRPQGVRISRDLFLSALSKPRPPFSPFPVLCYFFQMPVVSVPGPLP